MAILGNMQVDPLAYIGLGLLANSGRSTQPQTVGQGLLQGLQLANQAQFSDAQMKRAQVQDKLANMQLQQAQDRQAAISGMFGGTDPNTGITWETGRQGVPQSDRMGMFARAFPEQFGQAYAQNLLPQKPVVVGESLVNPQTGQVVYQGDKQPAPGMVKDASGNWIMSPEYVEAQRKIREAGRNLTQVTVDNKGEFEFEKTYGKGLGERAVADLGAADSARKSIAQLDRLEALTRDFQTGKLAPAKSSVAAWAQELGIDPAKLGIDPNMAVNAQGIEAITNAMTVGQIGAGGFPANNFSDADRAFLQRTMPQLSTTPGGNQVIMQAMRQGFERNIDKEQMWLKARKEGKSYETFMQDWNDYVQKTPIFPRLGDDESGKQAYSSMKPGTVFLAPDGTTRIKR